MRARDRVDIVDPEGEVLDRVLGGRAAGGREIDGGGRGRAVAVAHEEQRVGGREGLARGAVLGEIGVDLEERVVVAVAAEREGDIDIAGGLGEAGGNVGVGGADLLPRHGLDRGAVAVIAVEDIVAAAAVDAVAAHAAIDGIGAIAGVDAVVVAERAAIDLFALRIGIGKVDAVIAAGAVDHPVLILGIGEGGIASGGVGVAVMRYHLVAAARDERLFGKGVTARGIAALGLEEHHLEGLAGDRVAQGPDLFGLDLAAGGASRGGGQVGGRGLSAAGVVVEGLPLDAGFVVGDDGAALARGGAVPDKALTGRGRNRPGRIEKIEIDRIRRHFYCPTRTSPGPFLRGPVIHPRMVNRG